MLEKDFIIGVDMDDTIENLREAWITWLNKKYNYSVDCTELAEWEIGKYFPELSTKQVVAPLVDKSFWNTVTPKSDAIRYLKKLYDEDFTIYICTNSHYDTLKYKFESVLFKYFPFIDTEHIIITSNKQLLNFDVLIDDSPKNLIGGSYKGILYNTMHSSTFNAEANGLVRVNNWEEIYNLIHKYFNEKR